MPDLVTTRAILQSQFADNVIGAISAQFARNLIVSSFGYVGATAPGANNDAVDSASIGAKFDVGSMWFDNVGGAVYGCLSGATGAAVWAKLFPAPAGGGGAITQIGRSSTSISNSGTTANDLWNLTVPGGTLVNTNDELRFQVYGNMANNSNNKFVILQWGATNLVNASSNFTGGPKWWIEGRITRTSPTAQKLFAKYVIGSYAQVFNFAMVNGAEVLSGNVTFKIQGNSSLAAGDVTFLAGYVDKASA
jgi:hypothetical protein